MKEKNKPIDSILDEFKPKLSPIMLGKVAGTTIVNFPLTKEEKLAAKKAEAEVEFEKRVNKHSIPELIAMAAGLPGRVRNLYHRIDKLIKNGKDHMEVLEDIQPIVAKYLAQRMDVAIFGVILLKREVAKHVADPSKVKPEDLPDVPSPEFSETMVAITKIMGTCMEADALMMLRAEYFLVGLTVHFCRAISSSEWPPHPALTFLYELIDLGNERSPKRQQRISAATKALRDMGAEIP